MSANLSVKSGPLAYKFTNDYMFRAIVQKSNKVLKHLISAILKISYEDIESCIITNPIILGENINEKTCILDVRVLLNNRKLINLEMQVGHLENWPDRAMFNLSRLYCNIKHGQDYGDILPSVHIGILNRSPFQNINEFYSEYMMINRKNMHVFSGKFLLYVLDLSQLNNLTAEERKSELYDWARLFMATTWEEVTSLMKNNDAIKEAAGYLKELSEDEKIQLQCEARERYFMDMSCAKREGFDAGKRAGEEIGKEIGKEIGRDEINQLNLCLSQDKRIEDLIKSTGDLEFQKKLMQEYHIAEQ